MTVAASSHSILRPTARRSIGTTAAAAAAAHLLSSSFIATTASSSTLPSSPSISPITNRYRHSPSACQRHETRRAVSVSAAGGASGADILASFEATNSSLEGTNIAQAMEALANADAVCFDVDSTVIQEEGIVSTVFGFGVG